MRSQRDFDPIVIEVLQSAVIGVLSDHRVLAMSGELCQGVRRKKFYDIDRSVGMLNFDDTFEQGDNIKPFKT